MDLPPITTFEGCAPDSSSAVQYGSVDDLSPWIKLSNKTSAFSDERITEMSELETHVNDGSMNWQSAGDQTVIRHDTR